MRDVIPDGGIEGKASFVIFGADILSQDSLETFSIRRDRYK